MNINSQFLSLPPHISTSWNQVTSLQVVRENNIQKLAIILKDGHIVKIPNLPDEIINLIFHHHSKYLESSENKQIIDQVASQGGIDLQKLMPGLGIPLQFGLDGFQGFGAMQHNQAQANAPDLPPEILNKIAQIANTLGISETAGSNIPQAEPHCNCFYCQVARCMGNQEPEEQAELEEEVSEEDLKFKEFDIEQKSDKLFVVQNPLDKSEHFQVFLGSPIGCTCGKKNCEHIKAVLNS